MVAVTVQPYASGRGSLHAAFIFTFRLHQIVALENLKEMTQAVAEMQKAAADYPEIKSITSLYQGEVPQYEIKVDRERAKLYGLRLENIYSTLAAYMEIGRASCRERVF